MATRIERRVAKFNCVRDPRARRWKNIPSVFLATLFSDMPRINFNGKTDEIDTIKQTFTDFLKKVVAETSRDKDQDDRFS